MMHETRPGVGVPRSSRSRSGARSRGLLLLTNILLERAGGDEAAPADLKGVEPPGMYLTIDGGYGDA